MTLSKMRRIKRVVIGLILIVSIVPVLTACGEQETLQIGVNDGYKPFGYKEDGKIQGFEIELWDAIAKEAGLKYELKAMASGELIRSVKNRSLDGAIAAITVKESRKKAVDFSTPYLHTGQALLIRQDEKRIRDGEDLKNKTVATKIGTTGYEYASMVKGIGEIQAYPDMEAAMKALEDRKVDAVIYDEPGLRYYVEHEGQGKVKTVGKTLTREHYAIAFPKGSRYTGAVNNALKKLGKNGTFERIYKKWFDQRPESLPRE